MSRPNVTATDDGFKISRAFTSFNLCSDWSLGVQWCGESNRYCTIWCANLTLLQSALTVYFRTLTYNALFT